MLVVGSESHKAICRIYNENEDVEMSYKVPDDEGVKPLKKYSEVCYVQANTFANIIVGTENGQL